MENDGKLKQTRDLGIYSVRAAGKHLTRPITIGKGSLILGLSAVLLVGGLVGLDWGRRSNQVNLSDQKKVANSQSQLISRIAKEVGPSVVSINTSLADPTAPAFDAYGYGGQAEGAGTGIIISADGLIITNRHVVPAGTTKVSVTLSDGTELKNVSVLGRTNDNDSLDIAFLKINDKQGRHLKPAALGNSSLMQVGDGVVAIGNTLGQFQNTVTSGIISGYGRSVQAGDASNLSAEPENLDNLFQTDAAINEGNSGGPLVNLNGQVIGINTALASGSQNVGFAIPINDARGLIKQISQKGTLARPYLGVRYVPLTADLAKQYGFKIDQGALVLPASESTAPSVIPDTPAALAGLREKDVIVAVNDKKVDQLHSLTSRLSQYQPGDKVKLTMYRDGKTINLYARLAALPNDQ